LLYGQFVSQVKAEEVVEVVEAAEVAEEEEEDKLHISLEAKDLI